MLDDLDRWIYVPGLLQEIDQREYENGLLPSVGINLPPSQLYLSPLAMFRRHEHDSSGAMSKIRTLPIRPQLLDCSKCINRVS